MSVKKQEFDITGMHCAACVKRVENVVSKVDGVESVKVNLLTRKGSVEYKDGATIDSQHSGIACMGRVCSCYYCSVRSWSHVL